MRFEWQKHRPPSAFSLFLLATCLLFALPLRAEVFWRLPKRADTVLQQMGGTRVYATDVQVNGAPGTLTAYAFGSGAAHVGAGLARRLGLPAPSPDGGAALLTHAEKDRLQRLFVLPAPSGGEACVVLALDQPLRAFEETLRNPPAWPEGLPALNATPVFSAVSRLTRTAFVTADSAAAPEEAAQEAAQALTGAGWTASAPATPAFRIFVSGRRQCVVLAARQPQTGRTAISLLQREGATP